MEQIKSYRNIISFLKNGDEIVKYLLIWPIMLLTILLTFFCLADTSHDLSMVDEFIPNLVNNIMNNLLTMPPSIKKVTHKVFNLNENNASSSDGFGGMFFQSYWNIIKKEACNAILQPFQLQPQNYHTPF